MPISKYDEEASETDRLKLALRQVGEKAKEQEEDLAALKVQSDLLAGEVVKGNETIDLLSRNFQNEHEEGFNKVIQQVAFLLKVDPLSARFDIGQNVYDGKMMPIHVSDAEDDEEPVGDDAEADDVDRNNDEGTGDDGEDEGDR